MLLLFALAAAAAPPDPAAVSAAEQTLLAADMPAVLASGVEPFVASQLASVPFLAGHEAELRAYARRVYAWDEVGPDLAALYASTYTHAELRQLRRFYRRPVGRKTLAQAEALQAATAAILQAHLVQHQAELIAAINAAPPPPPPPPRPPRLEDMVQALIRGHVEALRACYDAALLTAPELAGQWEVRVGIGADNATERVLLDGATQAPGLEACLAQEVGTWTFTNVQGPIELSFPLVFSR